jgi:hypothetical protein
MDVACQFEDAEALKAGVRRHILCAKIGTEVTDLHSAGRGKI